MRRSSRFYSNLAVTAGLAENCAVSLGRGFGPLPRRLEARNNVAVARLRTTNLKCLPPSLPACKCIAVESIELVAGIGKSHCALSLESRGLEAEGLVANPREQIVEQDN